MAKHRTAGSTTRYNVLLGASACFHPRLATTGKPRPQHTDLAPVPLPYKHRRYLPAIAIADKHFSHQGIYSHQLWKALLLLTDKQMQNEGSKVTESAQDQIRTLPGFASARLMLPINEALLPL